jgi:hypothetical protein
MSGDDWREIACGLADALCGYTEIYGLDEEDERALARFASKCREDGVDIPRGAQSPAPAWQGKTDSGSGVKRISWHPRCEWMQTCRNRLTKALRGGLRAIKHGLKRVRRKRP